MTAKRTSRLGPRHDWLIAEYVQCQAERTGASGRVWQSMSVFIASLAIAALAMNAVLGNDSLGMWYGIIITWAFWFAVVVGCWLWGQSVWQERFAQRMAHLRMVQIEDELRLRHHLYTWILGEGWDCRRHSRYWKRLTQKERNYLECGVAKGLFAGKFPVTGSLVPIPRVAAFSGGGLAAIGAAVAFTVAAIAITIFLANRSDAEAASTGLCLLC